MALTFDDGPDPRGTPQVLHLLRATASAVSIVTDLTRDLVGGEILMLHDADRYSVPCSWRRTLAALPAIIGDVRAAGLEFRSIG